MTFWDLTKHVLLFDAACTPLVVAMLVGVVLYMKHFRASFELVGEKHGVRYYQHKTKPRVRRMERVNNPPVDYDWLRGRTQTIS